MSLRRLGLWALLALWAAAAAAASPGASVPQSTCVTCHLAEEGDAPEAAELNLGGSLRVELPLSLPTREWRDSVHAQHEVSCDGCHGGDPRSEDEEESMSEEAGFLENPSWMEMAQFCGACHEALAESYTAGRFGRLMQQGQRVPTCASCHMPDGHRIRAALPEDLIPALPCPDCPPLEAQPAVLRALQGVHELQRAAAEGVARAEAAGIELTQLRSELAQLGRRGAVQLHGFEGPAILAAAEERASELRALHAEAEGWQREARRRRRFGSLILAALGLLFGALLVYRVDSSEEAR